MKDRIDEAIDMVLKKGTQSEDLQRSYIQYIKQANHFSPAGHIELVDSLDPHAYVIKQTPAGIQFEKTSFRTDELYLFEGSKMHSVLEEIERFWTLKDNFDKLGYLHNRGILMYGPPGTGKSCLIQQVAESMVKQGDILFFARGLSEVREGLPQFREVESERRCVVVFEDMDEYIGYQERAMLQLLDGSDSVDNVLYLGTTNYIEKFPPRLLRPGRFDKKVGIGFPPYEGRLVYLRHKLKGIAEDSQIEQIAKKTKGFSFGHLRELVISGFAFEEDIDETIKRLGGLGYDLLPEREDAEVEEILESRR